MKRVSRLGLTLAGLCAIAPVSGCAALISPQQTAAYQYNGGDGAWTTYDDVAVRGMMLIAGDNGQANLYYSIINSSSDEATVTVKVADTSVTSHVKAGEAVIGDTSEFSEDSADIVVSDDAHSTTPSQAPEEPAHNTEHAGQGEPEATPSAEAEDHGSVPDADNTNFNPDPAIAAVENNPDEGDAEPPVLVEHLTAKPGTLAEVTVTINGHTDIVKTQVLSGALPEYRKLVPGGYTPAPQETEQGTHENAHEAGHGTHNEHAPDSGH